MHLYEVAQFSVTGLWAAEYFSKCQTPAHIKDWWIHLWLVFQPWNWASLDKLPNPVWFSTNSGSSVLDLVHPIPQCIGQAQIISNSNCQITEKCNFLLQVWTRRGNCKHMWCDQAKWVWSQKFLFSVFCHFLLGYYLSFNSMKTPWGLGNWFLRNSISSDWKNNKKQRNYLALSWLYHWINICEFRLILLDCITYSHAFAFLQQTKQQVK